MKNILKFAVGVVGILSLSPVVQAAVLMDSQGDSITAASLQQYGRISRSATGAERPAQTWDPKVSGLTAYPGAINTKSTDTPTVYNYVTYTFTSEQIGNGQYVQILVNEPSGNRDLFVSAWTSYNGTNSVLTGKDYLGDTGFSGNIFDASDRVYCDVTVPKGASLVVVVNTTSDDGIGEPYGLQVNSYATRDYNNGVPNITPDKAPFPGKGGGAASEFALIGGAAVIRRRRAAATS